MKKEVTVKLEELRDYVKDLEEYRRYSLSEIKSDKTLRRAIERYLQISLECVIDVGEMIISYENLKRPDNYREVIEILGENDILPEKFAEGFAPAAGFRNLLVHMYSVIDTGRLYRFLQDNLDDFDKFARYVAEYLER